MAVVKRLNVWRKFHGLDLTFAGDEVWKSLELSPRKTNHAFPSSDGLQQINLLFCCCKGKSPSISMLLELAVYYFLIVLAEARHTCHAWLYDFLPEYEYNEKY